MGDSLSRLLVGLHWAFSRGDNRVGMAVKAQEQAKRLEAEHAEAMGLLQETVLRLSRRIAHGDGYGGRVECESGAACGFCRLDEDLMARASALIVRAGK